MSHFAAAFSLSYSVHVVGTYFDGAAMIAQIGGSGHTSLRDACTEQLEMLSQQGPTTKWHVRRVEKIMSMLEVSAVSMPKTPDEYPDWVDQVATRAYPELERNEGGPQGYALGWYLGSFVEHANLAAFALMLKDIGEEVPAINAILRDVSTELKSASRGFQESLQSGGNPDPMVSDLTQAGQQMSKAPPLADDKEEPLDIADDVQEILYELGLIVERLENRFQVTW